MDEKTRKTITLFFKNLKDKRIKHKKLKENSITSLKFSQKFSTGNS